MTDETDTQDLKVACFELAQALLWQERPVDVGEIQTQADTLFNEAKFHVHDTDTFLIDAGLVARAVRYITQAHATPQGLDVRWFSITLRTLLEIARPNAALEGEGLAFVADMMDGLGSMND